MISDGRTLRFSRRYFSRDTSVFVFPVPGPALTAIRSAPDVTARSCSGFRSGAVFPPWLSPESSMLSASASAVFLPVRSALSSPALFLSAHSVPEPALSVLPASAPIMSKKLICPSVFSSSSVLNRRITPYSPSKPGIRSTCPLRSRRMPSAILVPDTRRISSRGSVLSISNSAPSSESICTYSFSAFLLAAEQPIDAAITSGSGTRLSNAFAPSRTYPSGRSASSSTRCDTPIVILRPHTGHTPLYFIVSEGVRQRLHFLCPSI